MARPVRPATKRKKAVHRNLPEYLKGPVHADAPAMSAALPERPVSTAGVSTRQYLHRDFSHVKSDLMRIFLISAFLSLVLAALTFVLS